MTEPIGGIFIGGEGRRLGKIPKGLLRATPNGETIVARTRRLLEAANVECILVGKHDAYDDPFLEDDPRARGPLAGLLALLSYAGARTAIAIACDMPFVTEPVLRTLLTTPSTAPILAPRREGRWEPFFARYDAARVLPLAIDRAMRGEDRLQGLLDDAKAEALVFDRDDENVLLDWDTPADLPPGFTDARLRGKREP